MSWWNPFSTEANNGKTTEQLDAELAALDAARAARKAAEADALDESGFTLEADNLRNIESVWQAQHAANLDSEKEALKETPLDAFTDELDARASALGAAGDSVITKTLATIFRAVPWWVWIALAVGGFFYFGGASLVRAGVKRKVGA